MQPKYLELQSEDWDKNRDENGEETNEERQPQHSLVIVEKSHFYFEKNDMCYTIWSIITKGNSKIKQKKNNNNSKGTDTDYKVHTILVQTERKNSLLKQNKGNYLS